MRIDRLFRFLALAILSLLFVFIWFYVKSPKDKDSGLRYQVNNVFGTKCKPYHQSNYSKKLRDLVPAYIERSKATGIEKCLNENDIHDRVRERELFRVNNRPAVIIEKLTHSYPYLTRDGKSLLGEIGKRFRKRVSDAGIRRASIRVTSLTRTTEVLKKLRSVNTNASENSPHFYGNAFDISYVRFSAGKWFLTDCDRWYMKEALAQVIWELREERKCWATYEVNQGCFHVVAR